MNSVGTGLFKVCRVVDSTVVSGCLGPFVFMLTLLIIVLSSSCYPLSVLPPPGEISFLSVKPDSVTLTWGPPEGRGGSRTFRVTWEGDGEQKNLIIKDMYRVQITGLQPGQRYDFKVVAMGAKGGVSSSVSQTVITGNILLLQLKLEIL